jgi:internalin A
VIISEHEGATEEIARRLENCRLTGGKVLDLSNLDITEIPAEVEGFEDLTYLNISGNQLEPLPDWIGSFSSLQFLNLRHCGLKSLPETMKNLSGLRTLCLGANGLSALPEWLGGFAALEKLDISANELYLIPEFIGNLKNLTSLDLGHSGEWENITVNFWRSFFNEKINKLDKLPDFLTKLPRLISLNLGFTALKSLPDCLRALRLESLKINNNELTEIPEWLGTMTDLRELDLSGNVEIKYLPNSLSRLCNLEGLNITNMPIIKFPECIRNFKKLKKLAIYTAKLSSPFFLTFLFIQEIIQQ